MARFLSVSAALCATVLFFTGGAVTAGPPLGCEDWVILEDGIRCTIVVDYPCQTEVGYLRKECLIGNEIKAMNNDSELLYAYTDLNNPIGECRGQNLYRTYVEAQDGDATHVIAYVDDKCMDGENTDLHLYVRTTHDTDCGPGGMRCARVQFDPVRGRVDFMMKENCVGDHEDCENRFGSDGGHVVFGFEGFTTLFDVLQTYDPDSGKFGFRVPVYPEGFRDVEFFDTYWGIVEYPLDLSGARPLKCGYPPDGGERGEWLTFADRVADPDPGSAIYYLTVVNAETGERHAGRRAAGGQLSGREPVVPPCD